MEQIKNQNKQQKSMKQRIAIGAVATAGILTAKVGLDTMKELNKPPMASAAEVAFFETEAAPTKEGVMVIRSGANIRTTPERAPANGGPNDPTDLKASKNIADVSIPEGKSLVVVNPYVTEDGFYGFTLPDQDSNTTGTEVATNDAKQTFWVDYNPLKKQGLADFPSNETYLDPMIDVPALGAFIPETEVKSFTEFVTSGDK